MSHPFDINKYLNGGSLSICYTLLTDDITVGKKPPQTPYVDRRDDLVWENNVQKGKATDSTVEYTPYLDGVKITVTSKSEGLSEFGVNLPFNFMSKKNGGGWENQFLFNTPYVSPDKSIMYFYLTNLAGTWTGPFAFDSTELPIITLYLM